MLNAGVNLITPIINPACFAVELTGCLSSHGKCMYAIWIGGILFVYYNKLAKKFLLLTLISFMQVLDMYFAKTFIKLFFEMDFPQLLAKLHELYALIHCRYLLYR